MPKLNKYALELAFYASCGGSRPSKQADLMGEDDPAQPLFPLADEYYVKFGSGTLHTMAFELLYQKLESEEEGHA